MKAHACLAPPLATWSLAAAMVTASSLAFAADTKTNAAAPANGAMVVVAKATNACFSDLVRVTGFVVPRREALVGVETEGSKVTEVLVREGDLVTENQELARLAPPPTPGNARPNLVSLRAPAS